MRGGNLVFVRRWGLWVEQDRSDPTGHVASFFRANNKGARRDAQEAGLVFSWATMARNYRDAHQALCDHRGWGAAAPVASPWKLLFRPFVKRWRT